MLNFFHQWTSRVWQRHPAYLWHHSLAETYHVMSSASVEVLWRTVENLADVSWHPLLASTNVPHGIVAKPGLIYQAMTRLLPIPVSIFVERVSPQELLSVRVLAIPGLEERVTYRMESTVCGTQLSYSVTLRGWLAPLVWSITQRHAARVAVELAQAAEDAALGGMGTRRSPQQQFRDLLGIGVILCTAVQGAAWMA